MGKLQIYFTVLPPSLDLSEDQRWQLVDSLYLPKRSVGDAAWAMSTVVFAGFLRTGLRWYLLWIGLTLAVAAARIGMVNLYHARAAHSLSASDRDDAWHWVMYYILGVVCAGAVWGAGVGYAILTTQDQHILSLLLMTHGAWLALAMTRVNASPATAAAHMVSSAIPIATALMLAADHGMRMMLMVIALQIPVCFKVTRVLTRQTMALLESKANTEDLNEQLREINAELGQSNHRLRNLSTTDGLTDITNRRGFDEVLRREWRRAAREKGSVGLILIDVDFFKKYNDSYGHLAGDLCLQRIARVLVEQLKRGSDLAARFGGEEFAVLLPATTPAGVRHVAERLRRAICALGIDHSGNDAGVVTISAGVVYEQPKSHEGIRAFIDEADQALYQAKLGGRNRIMLAEGVGETIN